jgi:serine palmitoyltransferase
LIPFGHQQHSTVQKGRRAMPELTSPKRFPKEAKAYLSAIVASPSSKTRRRLGLRSRSSSDDTLSTSSFATSRVLGHESPLSNRNSSRSRSGSSSGSSVTSALPVVPVDALHIEPAASFDVDPHWLPFPDDPHAMRHAEYGFDDNPEYRYTSQWRGPDIDSLDVHEDEPSLMTFLTTYVSYLILIIVGHVRDFVGKRTHSKYYKSLTEQNVRLVSPARRRPKLIRCFRATRL